MGPNNQPRGQLPSRWALQRFVSNGTYKRLGCGLLCEAEASIAPIEAYIEKHNQPLKALTWKETIDWESKGGRRPWERQSNQRRIRVTCNPCDALREGHA
jgi:hypothetical protein